MRGHLLLTNCLEDELTRPHIELAMKADRLLWLDLEGTDDEPATRLDGQEELTRRTGSAHDAERPGRVPRYRTSAGRSGTGFSLR